MSSPAEVLPPETPAKESFRLVVTQESDGRWRAEATGMVVVFETPDGVHRVTCSGFHSISPDRSAAVMSLKNQFNALMLSPLR